MTLPLFFTSFMAFFRRSSKSPRYLEPATMLARSSENTILFLSRSGTWLFTMACASPSTTADLPTPGSPMSTGLFLVRRESTWIILSISFLRPMTGSILPSRAFCVRLTPYFSISPPRESDLRSAWAEGRCCSANLETNDSKGSRFISSFSSLKPSCSTTSSLETRRVTFTPMALNMRMARQVGSAIMA